MENNNKEEYVKVNNVYILTTEQFNALRDNEKKYRSALIDLVGTINTRLNHLVELKESIKKIVDNYDK